MNLVPALPPSDFGVSGVGDVGPPGSKSDPRKSRVFSLSSSTKFCRRDVRVRNSSLANFSALRNSLSSGPLRKTAGFGKVGPKKGTSSRAVTETL
uniref:CSON008351 protein n=1 Tax=Culicoides sonorensis TaxID=179676 RepID=A0A336MZR3_CULSO